MPRIDRRKLEAFRTEHTGSSASRSQAQDGAARLDDFATRASFFVDGIDGARSFSAAGLSPVQDSGRLDRLIDVTPDRRALLCERPDTFALLLDEALSRHASYLHPEPGSISGARTRFKLKNVVGQRTTQFIDEAKRLADDLYADPVARDAAYEAANRRVAELLERELDLAGLEIDESSSFGHDAALLHAWEQRLEELARADTARLSPEDLEAHAREVKRLHGELDAMLRDRYVYNNPAMQETNAEESVGLCIIDARTRRRVSETPESRVLFAPTFELLSVFVDDDSRSVFHDRDAGTYFFDRTGDRVPEELLVSLVRDPLSPEDAARLTFRRPVGTEPLRRGFRCDFSGDGYVQATVIDGAGWAAHCSERPNLASDALVVPLDVEGFHVYGPPSDAPQLRYLRRVLDEALLLAPSCPGPARSAQRVDELERSRLETALAASRARSTITAEGLRRWTGRLPELGFVSVTRDEASSWAKVELAPDPRVGVGGGRFLLKLSSGGSVEAYVSLEPLATTPWQRSFLDEVEAGDSHSFEPQIERAAGGAVSREPVANLLELFHAAFRSRPHTLMHGGRRRFFDTRQAFEAELCRLECTRAVIYGEVSRPAMGVRALLEASGHVGRGEIVHHDVIALTEGPLTVKLETLRGDADLFVKLGAAATNENYTKKADARGRCPDEIAFDCLARGDRIGIAVYAFEDSDYTLRVHGGVQARGEQA